MLLLETDLSAVLEDTIAERCRRSFARFAQAAWPLVDPKPLVWNWHAQAICEHLQAVTEGKIQRLIINLPPGHAKSMLVSVLWPAWEWIKKPERQMLTASYKIELATRDSVKTRTLVSSPWYQKHFASTWALKGDQNVKSFYANSAKGFRICLSVGGGTGYRADCLTIDDPVSAEEANSKVALEAAIRWKTETMSSRFNEMKEAREVIIMQRLHELDLSGYLLPSGDWEHLRLPSEFETLPECACVTCRRGHTLIGWKDPRTKEGELLFPAMFPKEVLTAAKSPGTGMGALAYAGQHQQRPVPASGNMILRAWLANRWSPSAPEGRVQHQGMPEGVLVRRYNPRDLEARPNSRFMMTDAAFKKLEDNDLVAIGVFDRVGPDLYLLDMDWRRMGFVDTVKALKAMYDKWPGVSAVRIEDKANGSAIIDVLKRKMPGVQEVEPEGSKEARISSASEFMNSGNVWLPYEHPQTDALVAEAVTFPRGAHDDGIDMLAYGVITGLMRHKRAWQDSVNKR